MNREALKSIVKEELSRFQFMQHLAKSHPDLNAKQIGEIYKLYKNGISIDLAVKQVTGVNEQEEGELAKKRLGATTMTRAKQATVARQKGKDIASGDTLSGIDNRERAIMVDLEKIIAAVAEKDDLVKYKTALQSIVDRIRKASGV
tara:strand:+ start:746 stop:1183 length:438 start_codon:yes stop_codon:yes gene_type:complete